jgi:hypothetical protein
MIFAHLNEIDWYDWEVEGLEMRHFLGFDGAAMRHMGPVVASPRLSRKMRYGT